jgi:hypothetical protein
MKKLPLSYLPHAKEDAQGSVFMNDGSLFADLIGSAATSQKQMDTRASLIVEAINHTYGEGINPSSAKKMKKALEHIQSRYLTMEGLEMIKDALESTALPKSESVKP